VIGAADQRIRLAVFDWLAQQRELHGEALSRDSLEGFALDGRPIPLVGPSGIWKPAACELPISVTTSYQSPYTDSWTGREGEVRYSYRGTDPQHRDNVGLRRAMRERVPLVYFLALEPGVYAAAYPTFIVGDDPAGLHFTLQVDDATASLQLPDRADTYPEADPEPRRAYVTTVVQRRLHQLAFRERVIRAYEERCALCRLRHRELLDAAHITPDRDPAGDPVVSNGMALCKLHHAAFDQFFFAVRPDYRIEVRPSLLAETDGPMLVVGLQQIHGQQIHLPRRVVNLPDRDRLERRYAEFRRVSAA
jgi:putative restriction endonuclease